MFHSEHMAWNRESSHLQCKDFAGSPDLQIHPAHMDPEISAVLYVETKQCLLFPRREQASGWACPAHWHCTSFPCLALVRLGDPLGGPDWWVVVGFLVDLIPALLTPITEMMQSYRGPGYAFRWPTWARTGTCTGSGEPGPGGAAHPGAEA